MNACDVRDSPDTDQPRKSNCSAWCRWLLATTGASRTTIRLFGASGTLELVAEALAEGVRSIREGTQVDPTAYPTYRHLAETRTPLIQTDTRTHPIRPPDSLVGEFRVYAQMLAPILREGRLVGVVSVHVQDRPHRFDESQIAALDAVAVRLRVGDTPDRPSSVEQHEGLRP